MSPSLTEQIDPPVATPAPAPTLTPAPPTLTPAPTPAPAPASHPDQIASNSSTQVFSAPAIILEGILMGLEITQKLKLDRNRNWSFKLGPEIGVRNVKVLVTDPNTNTTLSVITDKRCLNTPLPWFCIGGDKGNRNTFQTLSKHEKEKQERARKHKKKRYPPIF